MKIINLPSGQWESVLATTATHMVNIGSATLNISETPDGHIVAADIVNIGKPTTDSIANYFNDRTLLVCATPLRLAVWHELTKISPGQRLSYSELASRVGHPKAVRAVASAVAANRIALAIPCHRVVRADGTTGQYRWGSDIKQLLLNAERQIMS